jgi:serine/threonine protein kinase
VTEPSASAPKVPGLTGLTVLARGGYATVYRAEQESVGRPVAVKIENRTLETERDRRRFLREARAAGRMSGHPHVIDLFDAGVTADGHPYLIMELCEGTYAERMRNNPLSAAEARDVGMKIADALADSHALGVLHRDVKPANILCSRFGEPALADFGLAILVESRDTSITLDVLTPAYAPPEMFRSAEPSPAADVYALCATLYALMHGRPPRWREDHMPSLVSLVDMFAEPLPDIPGVPPEMMALLRAGMASDESVRPSAADLRDGLMALRLDPSVRPAPPSFPNPPPDEQPTQPRRRRRFRLGWWFTAGAVVLVLLSIGLAWAALRGGPPLPGGGGGPSESATVSSTPSPVDCVLTSARPNLRCVASPECYGALTVTGGYATAARIPCERSHPWEVFAVDALPAEVRTADQATVKSNTYVRGSCSATNAALLDVTAFNWRIDVLPPGRDAFRAGDRTFRCLAGAPAGDSTGAVFARPR